MKIGIFSDTYYPQINGVATSVLLLKEYLEKKGHEVYVFTTTDPKAPVHEERVARYPSIPFSNTGRRIAAVLYPAIERAFKRNDFDIIHTHTEFSIGILGRRLARSLEIPHVHTMHTIYEDYTHYIARWKVLTPVNRALARKYTASFCNSADRVIVPTEKTKELLLSYGVSRKIEVIPTGLRLERFAKSAWKPEEVEKAREGLGLGKNDMAVIYIGRVSKEKNLDEIVSAMAAYLPFHQDVKLVLVGDGPERKNWNPLLGNWAFEPGDLCRGASLGGDRPLLQRWRRFRQRIHQRNPGTDLYRGLGCWTAFGSAGRPMPAECSTGRRKRLHVQRQK